MAKRVNVNAKDKALVVNRAKGCCEYCKSPADFSTELFSIEHILPISLNGTNEIDNLAFACIGCNAVL
jgi:5-methylcytosine-specific restriction endonuclease McrA